jgi:hypothetical protein
MDQSMDFESIEALMADEAVLEAVFRKDGGGVYRW